jgi:hypothetical protein
MNNQTHTQRLVVLLLFWLLLNAGIVALLTFTGQPFSLAVGIVAGGNLLAAAIRWLRQRPN